MEEKILNIIRKYDIPSYTVTAKEITEMMVSFITWLYVRCHQFVLKDKDKAIFYNIDDKTIWPLEEVFIYWDKNIFQKKQEKPIRKRNTINN